jgi:hypothetical protein
MHRSLYTLGFLASVWCETGGTTSAGETVTVIANIATIVTTTVATKGSAGGACDTKIVEIGFTTALLVGAISANF